jgi:peptide/nickel transport system permease protein
MRIQFLILRRLIVTVPVLVGVTALTFLVSHSVPGDPARALAGIYADADTVSAIREKWGLDEPLYRQYTTYVDRLAHGDLGVSIQTRNPVRSDIAERLPATLELTLFALVVMAVFGIALGVAAAVWRNRGPDHVARLVVIGGAAVPSFFLALVLQLFFFRHLGWLPATGRLGDATVPPPHHTGFYLVDSMLARDWGALGDALRHLLLPGVTLAMVGVAGITRMTRASMLEVLDKDYIRAARARGLGSGTVVLQHALKNALIPTVTVLGLLFGSMIGGAIVIEWIFAWPGVGTYAATSITNLDYTAIMGVSVVIAVIYLLANTLVDISYMVLNPAIRDR